MRPRALQTGIGALHALLPILRALRQAASRREEGFHGDLVYRRLMDDLATVLPITSFVETGSGRGHSTMYVASRHRRLTVFSCEIDAERYRHTRIRLMRFRNTRISHGTSPDFLRRLLADGAVGTFPLVFLDAHWYEHWPLEDELRILTAAPIKQLIVIDDFRVPGQPQFGFDVGGGAVRHGRPSLDQRPCAFELVRPVLSPSRRYRTLLPCYGREAAFPGTDREPRGHVVLFVDCDPEFETFRRVAGTAAHYFEGPVLNGGEAAGR